MTIEITSQLPKRDARPSPPRRLGSDPPGGRVTEFPRQPAAFLHVGDGNLLLFAEAFDAKSNRLAGFEVRLWVLPHTDSGIVTSNQ